MGSANTDGQPVDMTVRVGVFHLDRLPRCEHNRVICWACGLDPFDAKPAHHPLGNLPDPPP